MKKTALMCLVVLLSSRPAVLHAQSLRGGVGIAGVENFAPARLNFEIGLAIPLTTKISAELSYDRWQGQDENYSADLHAPAFWTDRSYFGNSGCQALVSYAMKLSGKFSTSIGAGLGIYEKCTLEKSGVKDSFFVSAFAISPRIEYTLSDQIAAFGKLTVSTEAVSKGPDWGLFIIGIRVSPF